MGIQRRYKNLYTGRHLWPLIGILSTVLMCIFAVHAYGSERRIVIQSRPYSFVDMHENRVQVLMDGFGTLTSPGYPALPSRIFLIAFPPHARILSVDVGSQKLEFLPDTYDIMCTKPIVPSGESDDDVRSLLSEYRRAKETIWSTDRYFPERAGEYLGTDYHGSIPVVKVRFTPFSYNPLTRNVRIVHELIVDVSYNDGPVPSGDSREIHYSQSKGISSLIDDISYLETGDAMNSLEIMSDETSLLIIGSESLQAHLNTFIDSKRNMGYRVEFSSIEDVYSTSEGFEDTEKIRNFVRNKFLHSRIDYLLIIGDIHQIPMKEFYPNPDNHWRTGLIPSDLYYAELTGHWDSDGDGYYGEYGEDDIDLMPEIHVGRIPFNDPVVVSNILQKTIEYEQDHGVWKTQTLLIGAMNNFYNEDNNGYDFYRTDGANLMEKIKESIFVNMDAKTLYEKEGLNPSEYNCDYPLTIDNVISSWSMASYGCAIWWAHGIYNAAMRKWWAVDDGDWIPESNEMNCESFISVNNHPVGGRYQPIVFANSCDNGRPEKENLGKVLLKDASTGIISATRTTWYVLGWDDFSDGGNASMAFCFWDALAKKSQTVGEAINYSRLKYHTNFNDIWQHLANIYSYNYYGDPTLKLESPSVSYGGVSGIVRSKEDTTVVLSGLDVELLGTSFVGITDSNGRFHFPQVPVGGYTLHISGKAISPYESEIQVITGQMTFLIIDITYTGSPLVVLSDTTMATEIQEGYADERMLKITNTGSSDLKYRCDYDPKSAPWFSVGSEQRIVKPGMTDSIRIAFTTLDFDYGDYTSKFTLIMHQSVDSLLDIPVTMHVIDTIPPAPIEDLEILNTYQESVELTWTAPGDNDNSGQAEKYEIWMSNQPIQEMNAENAVLVCDTLKPGLPGSSERVVISIESQEQAQWIVIKTWDEVGLYSSSNIISVIMTDIQEDHRNVMTYQLSQNYPNPFNSETFINFTLPREENIKIQIYNISGKLVKVLMNEHVPAGSHCAVWDGKDRWGKNVASGVYYYEFVCPAHREIKKLCYVK